MDYYVNHTRNETEGRVVCYAPSVVGLGGLSYGKESLTYTVLLFLLQLTLVILTTRATNVLLEPLHQPRYISEVIGGLLLGPTVMGQIPKFALTFFPLRSQLVLETFAQLGLIYFIFTVGIEVELGVVRRTGARALALAIACTTASFAVGSLLGLVLHSKLNEHGDPRGFLTFLGAALSVTAFSVLARILGELKLIGTDVGRLAISSAILSDICVWMLLAVAIALNNSESDLLALTWAVLSGAAFLAMSFLVLTPAMNWVVRQTPEGEQVDETYACSILVGVLVWALVADAIGTHAIFGAFIFGMAVPNGPLGEALIDMVEDFVAGVLLPLFFVIIGLRTDVGSIKDPVAAVFLVLIVALAAMARVGASLLVAFSYKMPLRDGFSLGLLMNAKGVIELIVLNIGRERKVLGDQSFAILVFTSVILTALVSPLAMAVLKRAHGLVWYKRRTVQWPKPESELRILACIHTTRNVPSTIALLDAIHPTKRSPIFVHVMHLIELTNRASAMLIVSNAVEAENHHHHHFGKDAVHHAHGPTNLGRLQTQSEQIMHAFETYEQHAGGVSVEPITTYTPYPTMHEDVCSHAEEKQAALIILPFHKQQTVDGGMEVMNPSIRLFNQHVLAAAPCSVAILVDRGLSTAARVPGQCAAFLHVTLLFFGGPDDREALAFVSRMVDHPLISLTVFRFVPKASRKLHTPKKHEQVLTVMTDEERERSLDDEHIDEFRRKSTAMGEVAYVEKVANNAEETVGAIREMGGTQGLYIVGRGQESELTAGLTDWSECPELGPIGDLLASSDFAEAASVLVVQRSVGGGAELDAMMVPDSPGRQVRLYLGKADDRVKSMFSNQRA